MLSKMFYVGSCILCMFVVSYMTTAVFYGFLIEGAHMHKVLMWIITAPFLVIINALMYIWFFGDNNEYY